MENVCIPGWLAGRKKKEVEIKANEILNLLGLSERLDNKPNQMSGGEQQRVAIARALAHDPPLILADEPTAHLDYVQVDGVLRLLRSLARPGRIVVVATHDERMIPLADRVVEMTPRAAGDAVPPEIRTLSAGEVLFEQGETGVRVFVVDDGEIELVRRRVDGGEEVLALARRGDYFGELAALFGLRRSAAARAITDAKVTGLGIRDFRARMQLGSVSEMLERAADH